MVQASWDLTQPLFSMMMADTSDQISLVTCRLIWYFLSATTSMAMAPLFEAAVLLGMSHGGAQGKRGIDCVTKINQDPDDDHC